MSRSSLTADELYNVMFHLSTRDVFRCMQVCQYWKTVLSDNQFWKEYVRRRFDLRVKTNIKEDPIYRWADRQEWCPGIRFDVGWRDAYVMRPFPTTWNCGVVVPFGFDPMLLDTKHLSGLCRCLEILTYMKEGIETLGLMSGAECGADSSTYRLSVILMRWDDDELPSEIELVKDIFPFPPEILRDVYAINKAKEVEKEEDFEENDFSEKLYFHSEDEHDSDKEDDKCLNSVFGRNWLSRQDKTYDFKKELAFFTWLQDIMVPSRYFVLGYEVVRPVVVFFITKLAPGWVAGILTSNYYD